MKCDGFWKGVGMLSLALGLTLSLLGCEQSRRNGETEPEGTAEPQVQADSACFVPQERTGIREQYLATLQNSFECTDTGVYFMCQDIKGNSFLLYGDHGSDTLVKLCGRPDCYHTGGECNAYFDGGTSVCYYDGYLYVTTAGVGSVKLFRVNLDGSDRMEVMNSSGLDPGPGYTGTEDAMAWGGVFSFSLFKVNKDGSEERKSYYYLLDGSMGGIRERMPGIGGKSDGKQCIIGGEAHSGVLGKTSFYLWEPDTNETNFLVDIPNLCTGYWGARTSYYMQEDGVIYQQNYADGSSQAVFDTGLKGECRLSCTPDYIIVSEHIPTESELAEQPDLEVTSKVPTLYIYSWDFELLEKVEMPHPVKTRTDDMLCGETEDRLILAAQLLGVPEYYIEKSDIGTGNVEIHPYQLPDLDLEEED